MPEFPKTIGGMPTWGVVAALGGAAIVGYFIFFRNNGQAQPSNIATFGGTGTNPADYSGSIGTLENQLLANQAQQTAAFQGLGTQLTDVNAGIGGLGTQLTDVNAGIGGLGTQLTDVNAGIGGLGTQLSGVQTGLTEANQNITGVRSDLAGVNAGIGGLGGALNGLGGTLNSLSGQLSGIGNQVTTVSDQVSGVNRAAVRDYYLQMAQLTGQTAGWNDPRVRQWEDLANSV